MKYILTSLFNVNSPVSNPYETIYFEFYHLVNDSWLRKKVKENLIGRAKFFYADMITLNAGYTIDVIFFCNKKDIFTTI